MQREVNFHLLELLLKIQLLRGHVSELGFAFRCLSLKFAHLFQNQLVLVSQFFDLLVLLLDNPFKLLNCLLQLVYYLVFIFALGVRKHEQCRLVDFVLRQKFGGLYPLHLCTISIMAQLCHDLQLVQLQFPKLLRQFRLRLSKHFVIKLLNHVQLRQQAHQIQGQIRLELHRLGQRVGGGIQQRLSAGARKELTQELKESPIHGMSWEIFESIMQTEFERFEFDQEQMKIEDNKLEEQFIDQIAKMKMGKSSRDCSICQANFQKGQIIMKLPCKHIFHEGCIVPWFGKSSLCPNCKFDLKEHFKQK